MSEPNAEPTVWPMSAQLYAPIALFVYNRPAHAKQTVASLLGNREAASSDLFVFSDGARSAEDAVAVEQVRSWMRELTGFASVTVIEREENLGLADSIISGVSQLCGDAGRVIVIEDDLILSPYFLRYMNDGLARYADAPEVASIHGYTYPVDCGLPATFFLRGADCWGWATWSRAWQVFEPDAANLLANLHEQGLERDFDLDGAGPYIKMLEDFIVGKNNSWAVRWHAATYLRGMFTLYPGKSLVQNIGIDGSGTHSGALDTYRSELADRAVAVDSIEISENRMAREAFRRYFESIRPGIVGRISRRLKDLIQLADKT